MRYFVIAFVIIVGIVALRAIQMKTGTTAKLIPREVLFGNPVKARPEISPDGKRLAYLAPIDNVLNIWVKTVGLNDDHAVTSDKHRGTRNYFWSPDSSHILYVQDTDGDENWRLYSTDLETNQTRCYTPFEKVQVRIAASNKDHPDTILIEMNKENPALHDLYELTLSSGDLTMIAKNSPELNAYGFYTDRHFKVRGALVAGDDGSHSFLMKRDNDSWEPLIHWDADDANTSEALGFNYDGTLLYLCDARNSNTSRCMTLNLKTKEYKLIAEDPHYDMSGILTDSDTYEILAVSFVKDKQEWQFFDKDFEKDVQEMRKLDKGELHIHGHDDAKVNYVISFEKDNGPLAYYLFNRTTKQGNLLFENRPALKQYKLASMEPIQYKSRDGFEVHGYLTRPVGKSGKSPLVLNVHGGPQSRDSWGYNSEVQWLANRGYAVLQVNYRGSTGYGKTFLNAGNKEWGAKMHDDLVDAVQWAVDQGIADPAKVSIYGGSYGGYAALVGATFTPNLFCCAVDIVGPSNLVTLLKSFPAYWSVANASIYRRVGNPETEEEFLKSRSPLFKAGNIKIPLLIAHGAQDPRVKQAEAEQIVAALKEKNIPYEYILFPDEGHGFARPENRLKFYAAAEKFLAAHLGGRFE